MYSIRLCLRFDKHYRIEETELSLTKWNDKKKLNIKSKMRWKTKSDRNIKIEQQDQYVKWPRFKIDLYERQREKIVTNWKIICEAMRLIMSFLTTIVQCAQMRRWWWCCEKRCSFRHFCIVLHINSGGLSHYHQHEKCVSAKHAYASTPFIIKRRAA